MGSSQRLAFRHIPGTFFPKALLLALDVIILTAAYLLTYTVRALTTPLSVERTVEFLTGAILCTTTALYLSGAYHRIWSCTSGHDVIVLVKAAGLSGLILGAVDFVLRPRPIPLSVVFVGHALAFAGFVAVRYRSRLLSGFDWRWRAIWNREFPQSEIRVLIVGAGDAGQVTAWRLKHRARGERCRVVGFVDDDPAKQKLYIEGCRVLGTRYDITRLAERLKIDLITVAIHNISGPDFRSILEFCESTDARIKIVPDVLAAINSNNNAPLLRDVRAEDLLGRQSVRWYPGVDATPILNKVVLVTGAAGSIGSELCRQILRYEPVRLIMLDNNESGLHDLYTELAPKDQDNSLVLALVDITDREALERIFRQYRPQVAFHAAAYKHVPMLEFYPQEAIRVNIGGTLNSAELARDYGVKRFVLISTDKAVNPSCVMGASKRVCELLMRAFSNGEDATRFTAVRFGNVLGSRGSVVPIFNRQIDAGGPVTITDKEMMRYFMSIPEAVSLVIQAACMTSGDDLFMLKMGEEVRIVDLAERMIRMRGLRPYIDIPITFTGVRPGEKLHEELCSPEEGLRPTLHPDIVQLVSHCYGQQPANFFERVHYLVTAEPLPGQDVLSQLQELVLVDEIVPEERQAVLA
ncbi:polysaccharide biosynthesis protein [Aggregatilinea lenta]|uniref:polysaccharide biosynthesis protein n=1 Tax=Aggregatilinea lenta TaxID=913108 RepID=UPI000E5BC23F|nr:nucleoside-diphosphate sugar epimerase/dehydratase [Aggregatilinea lenta]